MTDNAFPIEVPTEPGLYESQAFPLEHDFLPVRIFPDGRAAEYSDDGASVRIFYLIDFEHYAKEHGPFRRIDPITEEPTPPTTPTRRSSKPKAPEVAEVKTETEAAA